MLLRFPKPTRRRFFQATGLGLAAVAAVSVLDGCDSTDDEVDSDPVVVEEDSAESVFDTFEEADLTLTASNTWTFDVGNVLHPAEGTWVPVTTAGSSASPMVVAQALSTVSGELVEVVSAPISTSSNAVIYSVHCSDKVYAWVELDLVTRDWVLYASGFSAGALTGTTTTLWEGTSEWDPAPFAVSGSTVFWQVQPSLLGSSTGEYSHLYLWHLGDTTAEAVLESQGRFATDPTISGAHVIVTPRVLPDEGTYYGIAAYTVADDMGTRVDQLVMPQTVKPFHASRVGDRFLVSVEASYSTGGLLGQMGTYMGTEALGFTKLVREPSALGCGKDDVFLIKSTSSYFVLDLANKTYSTLYSYDRAVDYGEYPAREGEVEQFVTFATVKDEDTGYPANVIVRTFDLDAADEDETDETGETDADAESDADDSGASE